MIKIPKLQSNYTVEVCWIAAKFLIYVAEKDIQDATGAFQVCAGQDVGEEAAIYAIYDNLFQDDKLKL